MRHWLLFLYVIICAWLYFFNKDSYLPKTIWLLWLQGWDTVPYVVQSVRTSWEKHNPGWTVKLITEDNLHEYVDIPYINKVKSPAAKSDIIRLSLLEKHGGVWADATMLCMQPLDNWVHKLIQPSSIWMYHGREDCTVLASWFIIAKKDSYMIKRWKEKCDEYWKNKTEAHEYSWMDFLWIDLYNNDDKFKQEWSKVPKICCEDKGQSHMLAMKVNEIHPDLQDIIKNNPPHAIKLSHHNFNESDKNTNGNVAIKKSLNL